MIFNLKSAGPPGATSGQMVRTVHILEKQGFETGAG